MKIEIDLTNSLPFKGQMRAVEEYIFDNIKSKSYFDTDLNIIGTKRDTGVKVQTDFGKFHVSCHKTKGGMYKFKTWNAI